MSRKDRRAHLQNVAAVPAMISLLSKKEDRLSEVGDNIPEVSDLDCAFPSRYRELLPLWNDLSDDEKSQRGPFCNALQQLFFNGGTLAEYGIFPKPGYDLNKVMRYIRATLGDFGPRHEHKIGGIAHVLAKWCEFDDSKVKERA